MKKFAVLILALAMLLGPAPVLAETWIAFVGGIGQLYSGRWYASSGVGLGITQEQAIGQAMAACNKKGCRVATTFTYGCFYITTGNNAYGDVAVGYGPSPDAAIYAARSYGATNVNRPSGGCLNEYGQFFAY